MSTAVFLCKHTIQKLNFESPNLPSGYTNEMSYNCHVDLSSNLIVFIISLL